MVSIYPAQLTVHPAHPAGRIAAVNGADIGMTPEKNA
jgi:hypothetical protein